MGHWKDLLVWQKSHEFVLDIYKETANFPLDEKYNVINQIRRAAASIPANIVEGHSRNSKKDFMRFLYISRGSLEEVRYFFLLATDLNYIRKDSLEVFEEKAREVSYLLNALIKSLS